MKLKELRWKKSVMVLGAIVVAVVHGIMFLKFPDSFGKSPYEHFFEWVFLLSPIAIVGALGALMGKDIGEKAKLILLGLIVGAITAFITFLCLLYIDIPVDPYRIRK